eukprot:CAMPEP_0197179890 /NCGR_PEP_ID=MMETSP1423-20130617/4692_1 /TAXON_ID=476441 /ORGANISM="Pseudo-nitzschia heimii, Strain UNC1101" /LENGTH=492 /DNA_ID=CAMNT_0042629877 /DNA_START=96 /DNA_END=1571 /DNA_ORIENTATION=-
MAHLLMILSSSFLCHTNGFVPIPVGVLKFQSSEGGGIPSFCSERQDCRVSNLQPTQRRRTRYLAKSKSYDDGDEEDEDDDDDDDDYIDTDSLGDWRNFRRSLAMGSGDDSDDGIYTSNSSTTAVTASNEREVTENEKVLEKQNKALAEEYASAWAHQTPTPEVGGLVIRMPLEVELYRNYRHSIMGSKLRAKLVDDGEGKGIPTDDLALSHWYGRSQDLIEEQMKKIADMADEEGQVDATTLAEDHSEMLHLYLENQEQWQEVCLVLERTVSSEGSKSAKTLVLNRPMAFKLTKDLGKLVYLGTDDPSRTIDSKKVRGLTNFMLAFRDECAIYIGGSDDQSKPATLIHGIRDLPGAVEISPGSNIFRGGLEAAVEGVLAGTYTPLEFRFFVGCHDYDESMLDVEVRLGKYQPVACARALALKQCISLPKPLWHEVMELCDGDLPDISSLEMVKREEVTFQVVDDSYDMEMVIDDDDIEIIDDDDDEDTQSGW